MKWTLTHAFAAVLLAFLAALPLSVSDAFALSGGGNSYTCSKSNEGPVCICHGGSDCHDLLHSGMCSGTMSCSSVSCWCHMSANIANGHKGTSGLINGTTLGARNFHRSAPNSSGALTAGALTSHPQLPQTHPMPASPALTSLERRR